MGITISGATGIDMGDKPISNISQIDSTIINENTENVATENYVINNVGVANSSLVKTALNATGTAPIYACRAWVNFNGTGIVAIRASGNVSSITDNGTGEYVINFTIAMPDTNYACPCNIWSQNYGNGVVGLYTKTITQVSVSSLQNGGGNIDANSVEVSIFR